MTNQSNNAKQSSTTQRSQVLKNHRGAETLRLSTFLIAEQTCPKRMRSFQPISKDNKLVVAKHKDLILSQRSARAQLCNSNYVCGAPQQKKYDLLMSVFFGKDNSMGPADYGINRVDTATPQTFRTLASAGVGPEVKTDSRTQRAVLKKPSFLAYWLLPFLGLIPGNTIGQNKALEPHMFMRSNQETHLVYMGIKPTGATPHGANKAITNLEQAHEEYAVRNKLVSFYLKELETNYTDQKGNFALARPGIKTNKLVPVAIPKAGVERGQSLDAYLNFVLSMPLKPISNLDMLVSNTKKALAKGQVMPDTSADNGLLTSPLRKANFKIRPNSFYAQAFSNKIGLSKSENQIPEGASQLLTKRLELTPYGALNSSAKSITLKSHYLPFSLETVTNPGGVSAVGLQGRVTSTEVVAPYLGVVFSEKKNATPQSGDYAALPQVNLSIPGETKSQVLKHEDKLNLGLTFSNYLKYLKSRIALVMVEGQKYVGNRDINKVSTNISKTSVGQNIVKTALVMPSNKVVAKGYKTLNRSAKPELRLARTQNAISIVLNHKKFNHIAGSSNLAERVSSTLANRSVEEELVYITKKKDLQKKHKAKKQRLESRRQKKRKRFYPRPTWLRLRLGLSMSDRRADLAIKTSPTYFRNAELPEPHLQKVIDLKQRLRSSAILTSFGGSFSQKTSSALSYVKGNKINKLVNNRSKWQKTLNSTAYNQIVYNLIVSKNLLNTRFAADNLNKPRTGSLQGSAAFLAAQQGSYVSNQTSKVGLGPLPNSVSFYKSENKVLSDFVFRKKPPTELYPISSESRAQIQKLIQIKNNANYVNFERKSNNQTTPTKETNSSLFKDFWVWVYNITSRNSYNKTLLVDTVLNHLSVPINLSKHSNGLFSLWTPMGSSNREKVLFTNSEFNQKSLKLASWAFNQTNLLSSTNKRLNIWATLKLRNQSKNNKTKYIEKKLKKQLNSSLSPFVLKNLAKLEERNQPLLRLDNKTNMNFGKLASRINNKIHQKEQKLAFITNMSGTFAKTKQSKLGLQESGLNSKLSNEPFSNIVALSKSRAFLDKDGINNAEQTAMPKLNDKDILAVKTKARLSASSGRVSQIYGGQTKYLDNFSWWRYPPRFNTSLQSNISNLDISSSTVGFPNNKLGQGSSFTLATIGLLFHFCALISLVSISQLRCFIKFHLILLHKLSNGYLQILFKTSSIVQKYLRTSVMSLSLLVSPKQIFLTKNSQGSANKLAKKQTNLEEPNYSLVSAVRQSLGFQTLGSKRNKKAATWSLFEKLKKANQPRWQARAEQSTKTLLQSGAQKGVPSLGFKKAEQVIISTLTPTISNGGTKHISNSPKSAMYKQGSANKSGGPFRNVLFDKPFKQRDALLNLSGLASTDKAISNPLTGVYGNSTVAALNPSSQKEYSELVRKNLQLLQIGNQIAALKYTKETFNSVKKDTLNAGFKVVDTFESFLRIIYGIFEKPYEFTMDWIAYAFLVEWSSDVLSYTPQNNSAGGAQAKNWSTFAKLVNQNQLNLLFYTKQLVASSGMTTKGNMPSQNLALLGLSSVALSQFLTKRILYLNDCFLTVLYRPDTDLIVRQRKGTLFWDIWSDFLIKAADKYNINVPSLSNIKEEQNVLLENFLSDPTLISAPSKTSGFFASQRGFAATSISNTSRIYGLNSLKLEQSGFAANILKQKLAAKPPYAMLTALGQKNTATPLWENHNTSFGTRGHLDYLDLAQQSITYQSKETDLFLEYHPPKSFSHISAIKYYSLVQQPIGSLVCQIYSGILEKQIAKNVLVIGSTLSSNSASSGSADGLESMQKTLLIQALAGETEMKMITDNASRYAVVSRGFAVGIKYLKEVFEAITLNTPCLFLLEDIHLIGERRPQLISDHGDAFGSADSMSKATDANFGHSSGGAAVHEKNQISYQLSRHALADYKKPFKGDFSLAISTNHFSFDFFLKSSSNTGGPFANFSAVVTHPLANVSTTQSIFDSEPSSGQSSKQDSKAGLAIMNKKLTSKRNLMSLGQDAQGSSPKVLSSSLQLSTAKNSLLSPPSTSPFSVLLLKEQKKLKAKKIVKELPWIGLPSGSGGAQQVALLPRVSYSVRAKVSALAELGFSSMSAKLDMITDLLVIIDSVRGHRGFVVFATTHLPHILDPALRRPGRLDETISIPTLSNLWTRWEFSKTSLNPITSNTKHKLLDTSGYISNNPLGLSYKGTLDSTDFINLDLLARTAPNGDSALRAGSRVGNTSTGLAENNKKQNFFIKKTSAQDIGAYKDRVFLANKQKYITKLRHVAYYQMGKKLFCFGAPPLLKQGATLLGQVNNAAPPFNLSSFSPVYLNPTTYESVNTLTETSEFMLHYGPEALKYKSLYMSPKKGAGRNNNSGPPQSVGINNILVTLMGGKFTEFFASTSVPGTLLKDSNITKSAATTSTVESRNNKYTQNNPLMSKTNKPFISNPELTKNLIKANFISLYGIDQTWRAATSFTLSLVQKRYLFNKNLVVPKLLNFLNFGPLEEAPSPPSSNILVPAKRFENAKKGFKETIQYKLFGISTSLIQDKLESHKKQGYIRNIFNTSTATESSARQNSGLPTTSPGLTNQSLAEHQNQKLFSSNAEGSLLQITSGDVYKNKLLLPTSASSLYQNKILNRHKIALNNQWWNGLLTEHTAETLFLSDIDWRYTFIQDSNNPELNQKKVVTAQELFFAKLRSDSRFGAEQHSTSRQAPILEKGTLTAEKRYDSSRAVPQSQDVVIDFPDSDQYYNPKQRRWFVTSGYWNSWFNVNQDLQTEVFDYLIFESIITSFTILNNNRELLDYAVSKFIKTGLIKETNYKILLKKFS